MLTALTSSMPQEDCCESELVARHVGLDYASSKLPPSGSVKSTSRHEVYRDDKVHVLAEKCKTCIFRPVNDGRIQGLQPGRVAGMVQDARANESVIVCHDTLYRPDVRPAVCRGFFDLPRQPAPLQIADRLGYIAYDPPPSDS
jgi:hypothetical protein